MKVDIIDDEIFEGVNPAEVEKYLASKQWYRLSQSPDNVSIWERTDISSKKHRVWLPLDRKLEDFATNLKRVIKTVATVENRSQLRLIEDFETVGIGDVIRFGSSDPALKSSGSLRIDDGLTLLYRSHNMAAAAASSAVAKRPVHPSTRPQRVSEYLKNLLLGQTERGSYLVKLISPIASDQPRQLLTQRHDQPPLCEIPFQRQVVLTLFKSLSALLEITEEADKRGKFFFEPFQEAVSVGISANLCEAIAGSDEKKLILKPLEVSVSWSYAIEHPTENFPELARFPQHYMPLLLKAARTFRERNPEEVIFTGYVTSLRRSEHIQEPGSITIVGIHDGRQRNIRVELEKEPYGIAIRAHKEGLLVSVKGNLVKRGQQFFLDDPSNFHVRKEDVSEDSQP